MFKLSPLALVWILSFTATASVAHAQSVQIVGAPLVASAQENIMLSAVCTAAAVPAHSGPWILLLVVVLSLAGMLLTRRAAPAAALMLMVLPAVLVPDTTTAQSDPCSEVAWSANGGTYTATGPTFAFTPLATGTVQVTATLTSAQDEVAIEICSVDPQEPNESSSEAIFLGSFDNCDGPIQITGTVTGPNDEDWFEAHVSDALSCTFRPQVLVSSGTSTIETCVFPRCENGSTSITCGGGSVSVTVGSDDGCCKTGHQNGFVRHLTCDGFDDSSTVFVRLREPTGGALCANDYQGDLSF